MEPGLRVKPGLIIPWDEVEVRVDASGGPGGQHANKAATRAEARFDAANSSVLGPRQRARIIEKFGPIVVAKASDSRSQSRNRERALQRLAERLASALHVERRRVATKPTKGSKTRRVDAKKRRSETKFQRRRPTDSD